MSRFTDKYPESLINAVDFHYTRTLNGEDKTEYFCREDGHVFSQGLKNHARSIQIGSCGCSVCRTRRITEKCQETKLRERGRYAEQFPEALERAVDPELVKTLRCDDLAEYYCLADNHIYTQQLKPHVCSVKKGLCGCRECGYKAVGIRGRRTKTTLYGFYYENHPEVLIRAVDPEFVKTLSADDEAEYYCVRDGHIYSKKVSNHYQSVIRGTCGCQRCQGLISVYGSSAENFWKSFCQDLLNDTTEKDDNGNSLRVFKSRGELGTGQEIDIYIPEKSFGIEYNGSYYHGTLGVQGSHIQHKSDTYHQQKFLDAEQNGIHLIQIYDFMDDNFRHNYKRLIAHFLTAPSHRLGARKCYVSSIDKTVAQPFIDLYHFQGRTNNGNVFYGLFTKESDELVAVMQFGVPRYHAGGYQYELHRYAVKEDYAISGAAQKLFNQFIKDYNPDNIISYSDNDWFDGGVYPKLGFSFDGLTNPRYYWTKGTWDTTFTREQCMLKNLKSQYPDLWDKYKDIQCNKEDMIMTELNYMKVYTAGNKRWVWTK